MANFRKTCPSCNSLVHVRRSKCLSCGHEFPKAEPKPAKVADNSHQPSSDLVKMSLLSEVISEIRDLEYQMLGLDSALAKKEMLLAAMFERLKPRETAEL